MKSNDSRVLYDKEIKLLREASLRRKLMEVAVHIVHDETDVDIISERYTYCKPWHKVSEAVHICTRACYRRHRAMLERMHEQLDVIDRVLNN